MGDQFLAAQGLLYHAEKLSKSMSLLFEDEDAVDRTSLQQGDILQPTNLLRDKIREAHPYYAEGAADYDFFIVLTQSCDLVKRNGKKAKARYLTIAAVRPLETLLGRIMEKYTFPIAGFPIQVCDKQNELLVKNTLERLLHNTYDGFFFIKNGMHPALNKHYCAFLSLSIALKPEHYDACLGAKICQMKEIFQAKLGWLAGNMYSRVGTPDEEGDPETIKKEFFDDVLEKQSVWLTPRQRKELVGKMPAEGTLDKDAARTLINSVSTDIEAVAGRLAEQISQTILRSTEQSERIKHLIASDSVVRKIISRS